MKIRYENLVSSVRILTGSFAFLLVILIGSVIGLFRDVDPIRLLWTGIAVYIFFVWLGGKFAKLLERVNYEVTDIDRGKADQKKKPGEKHLGKLLDISQTAEGPF